MLRRGIESLVDENCGGIPTKLPDLLNNLGKTQLYFQECVISIQQAKRDSNDLLMSMDKMKETALCTQFPIIKTKELV